MDSSFLKALGHTKKMSDGKPPLSGSCFLLCVAPGGRNLGADKSPDSVCTRASTAWSIVTQLTCRCVRDSGGLVLGCGVFCHRALLQQQLTDTHFHRPYSVVTLQTTHGWGTLCPSRHRCLFYFKDGICMKEKVWDSIKMQLRSSW